MSENLKSCPFCGGVAVIGADSDCDDPDYRVCCTECTTGVPDEWHTLRSNAISAWNQRTPMPDEKWTMPIWMREERYIALRDKVREVLRMARMCDAQTGPTASDIATALTSALADCEKNNYKKLEQ